MSEYFLKENGIELIVELGKSIDEDFIPLPSDKVAPFKKIIIDFDKVKNINSCGIREWINFLSTIKGKEIIYKNCRKIIVDQMNIVHGFVNNEITVESIYLPYYCEDCNSEDIKLFKVKELRDGDKVKILDVLCKNCNKSMEFDEIAKQYFEFLNKL